MTKSKVEKFLQENSDPEDFIQQEKIKRYLNLRRLFDKLDTAIREHGAVVTVENGKQSYIKINPAVTEKEKINVQLLALERDFKLFLPKDNDPSKLPPKASVEDEEETLV